AQGVSQNVIARIPPTGDAKRHVILVAHLDTSKHRTLLPAPIPGTTFPLYTALLALLGLAGGSMLFDALRGKRGQNRLQLEAAFVSALGLGLTLFDESRPAVEGANDNASGVAALLGIAEQLQA